MDVPLTACATQALYLVDALSLGYSKRLRIGKITRSDACSDVMRNTTSPKPSQVILPGIEAGARVDGTLGGDEKDSTTSPNTIQAILPGIYDINLTTTKRD
jgi:hypothetical protein